MKMLAVGMEGLENVLHALTRGARLCAEDGCQLETADDATSFVVTRGGLMTALRLGGLRQRLDADTLDRLVADVSIALTPALVRPAHTLQVVLERDPDRTPRELDRLFAPVRRAARRAVRPASDPARTRAGTPARPGPDRRARCATVARPRLPASPATGRRAPAPWARPAPRSWRTPAGAASALGVAPLPRRKKRR